MAESKGNGDVLMMILGLFYLLLTLLLHACCCPSLFPSLFPSPLLSHQIPLSELTSDHTSPLIRIFCDVLLFTTELRGWLALQSFSLLPLGLGPVYSCPCSLNGSQFFLPLCFPFWLPFFGNILLHPNIPECHFCFLLPSSSFPTCSQISSHSHQAFSCSTSMFLWARALHLSIALHVKILRYLSAFRALCFRIA